MIDDIEPRRRVADALEVRLPSGHERDDGDIAESIAHVPRSSASTTSAPSERRACPIALRLADSFRDEDGLT